MVVFGTVTVVPVLLRTVADKIRIRAAEGFKL
jgi:hypothetical protein